MDHFNRRILFNSLSKSSFFFSFINFFPWKQHIPMLSVNQKSEILNVLITNQSIFKYPIGWKFSIIPLFLILDAKIQRYISHFWKVKNRIYTNLKENDLALIPINAILEKFDMTLENFNLNKTYMHNSMHKFLQIWWW